MPPHWERRLLSAACGAVAGYNIVGGIATGDRFNWILGCVALAAAWAFGYLATEVNR